MKIPFYDKSREINFRISLAFFNKVKSFFCHRQRQDEVAATCRPLTVRPFGHLKPASPLDRVRGRLATAGLPGLFLLGRGNNFSSSFVRVSRWQKHFKTTKVLPIFQLFSVILVCNNQTTHVLMVKFNHFKQLRLIIG
jgi:hypothetical protein